jgi:hypothetical protein
VSTCGEIKENPPLSVTKNHRNYPSKQQQKKQRRKRNARFSARTLRRPWRKPNGRGAAAGAGAGTVDGNRGLGGRRTGAGAAGLRSGGGRGMRKGSERSRVARVIAAALARNRPRELLVRPPPSLPRGARRAPISPGRPTGRSASRADGGRRKRIFGLVPGGPHGDVAGFFFFLLEDDDDPLGFPFRPRRTGDEEAASTHPGDESQGGASMSVGECAAGSAVRCATCTGPAGSSVPCGVGITVRLVRYDAAWRVGPAPARPALCLRAIVLGTTPDLLLRIFPLKPC